MYSGRAFSQGFPCLSQSSASSTYGAEDEKLVCETLLR